MGWKIWIRNYSWPITRWFLWDYTEHDTDKLYVTKEQNCHLTAALMFNRHAVIEYWNFMLHFHSNTNRSITIIELFSYSVSECKSCIFEQNKSIENSWSIQYEAF